MRFPRKQLETIPQKRGQSSIKSNSVTIDWVCKFNDRNDFAKQQNVHEKFTVHFLYLALDFICKLLQKELGL